MSARSTHPRPRRSPAQLAGIVLLSLLCLAGGAVLALWQWDRYSSASGTLQNLGYVLQWPLFGAFPAFLFWRILHAEPKKARAGEGHRRRDTKNTGSARTERAPAAAGTGRLSESGARSRLAYVPGSVEQQYDDDAELRRYNRYLAALHDRTGPHARAQRHSQEEHRVG